MHKGIRMAKKKLAKKVTIAKGVKVSKEKASKMRKRKGGSNVGKYSNVAKGDFAGKAGDAPAGSFPIPNISKARSALKLAHNAPNPEGIKRKVYSKFPQVKPKKKK